MSDEERRGDQERTMFDSSLLARIQEREREEREAAEAAPEAPLDPENLKDDVDAFPVPPPPPPSGYDMDDEETPPPHEDVVSAPPAPPPPPPPPPNIENQTDSLEPEAAAVDALDLDVPKQSDAEMDLLKTGTASSDPMGWEDDETTGTAPAPPPPEDEVNKEREEPETNPVLEPSHESLDDRPSNADGSLRAIHSSEPQIDTTPSESPSDDDSTRDLSPVATTDDSPKVSPFNDASTEEREPIEATPPGNTRSRLEPTRPGLATHVATDASLEDDDLVEETSHPTRPQTSAVDKSDDLWAESSIKDLARGDRKPLKAEETAMLPSLEGPETGDIDAVEIPPETTDEEVGITLLCDEGGAPPIHVKDRPIVLGRGQAADVTILESTLSRKHCQLELKGSRIWVTDLGSGNGTYINDDRLVGAGELKKGDRLRLGLKVSFQIPSDEGPAAPIADDEESPPTVVGASASGPTLMPDSAGFSTTNGQGVSGFHQNRRLKEWIPVAVASLIFIVGLTTQVIRHQKASQSQIQLNQADAKLMEGVGFFQKGEFKKAEEAIKLAGLQDPTHPMLSRYRDVLTKLVHQEAQLDDAARLIKAGELERASALLIALDAEEPLRAKAKELMNSMSQARMKGEIETVSKYIAEKKFKEAKALIARLKEAGLEESILRELEAKLPLATQNKRAPVRRPNALPVGPLSRVHRALRSGQIEEAFRINRDLASSGVKEAARLEGNLAELRELSGLAETAIQRRDHVRALTQTARALKLLKQISPTASGARNKLRTLRAKAFQAEAQDHGRAGRPCEARQSLDKAARFNRNIAGLTNGFRVVENHGSSELAEAKDEIQGGANVASVRHKLEMAICTHSRNSKVSKEARRLLRGP